jgi:peroxiredoxin
MENTALHSGARFKSIFLICLIAAALGIYVFIQWQKPSTQNNTSKWVAAGQPAPDFELPLLNGDVVRLDDYKGKIVFLNIWATWCGPCQEEMSSMERLYQQLKDQTFEILAVSIDAQGAPTVAPFVKEYKLNFPVLIDSENKIGRLYKTTGIPETFIIDKNGIIVSKVIGYRNWSDPEVVQTLRDLAQRPADKG